MFRKLREWRHERRLKRIAKQRRMYIDLAVGSLQDLCPEDAFTAIAEYCADKQKELQYLIAVDIEDVSDTYKLVQKGFKIAEENAKHFSEQFKELQEQTHKQMEELGIADYNPVHYYDINFAGWLEDAKEVNVNV